jgi:hypothetical protein
VIVGPLLSGRLLAAERPVVAEAAVHASVGERLELCRKQTIKSGSGADGPSRRWLCSRRTGKGTGKARADVRRVRRASPAPPRWPVLRLSARGTRARCCDLRFPKPRQQFDEVAGAVAAVELGVEDAVPAVFHGAGGAGQAEDIGAAGHPGAGAGLDGGGADALERQPAEQLAKAGDGLFDDGIQSFRRDVAPGDAGAAGGDDDVDGGIIDPGGELRHQRRHIVLQDGAGGEDMPGGGEAFDERIARPVVGEAARVRHGEHRDADGDEGKGGVDGHGGS